MIIITIFRVFITFSIFVASLFHLLKNLCSLFSSIHSIKRMNMQDINISLETLFLVCAKTVKVPFNDQKE